MSFTTEPIDLDADVLAHLPVDAATTLLAGQRLTLPGPMVWHAWGPVEGSVVVLLHGGSGSWMHWIRNIAPLVAQGRRVLAVDLPGFGDSAAPLQGGDVDALIEPLHAAWQLLKRPDVASTFVGFSFGGMTAALWLAAYPDDAAQLVMVGSPGLGLTVPDRIALKGWRHLPNEAMQAEAHRHNLMALMLRHEDSLDALAMAVHTANVKRDRMPRRRLSSTPIVVAALPRIQCPLHVVFGEWDALYKGRWLEVEAMFKAKAPQLASWQLVPDSGHWVQYERADAFQLALLACTAETAALSPNK
ncbi:MAG: 2-hydroxy-6-oxononadienedioate/2-hydroxy-6-oxononatrienedioate hydrolase [Pseudomonadota bacterium]|jgi:2-hydroxy-6-oxonona-2,4-dienedioate hydrolase